MKLSKKDHKSIETTIKYILKNYDFFSEQGDYLLESVQELSSYDDTFHIGFPAVDEFYVEAIDFLEISGEIPSIEVVNNKLVKTNLFRYYVVQANYDDDYIVRNYHNLISEHLTGIRINLVTNSVILGLGAIKIGEYDDDYLSVTDYLAIEIRYENKESILTPDKELELVTSYIFEIADSTGIALSFSEITNGLSDFQDFEERHKTSDISKIRDLEIYNEGMKLFISAVQIQEAELKFLNFYKILEHFSTVAVNIEANELMRKKLDAPRDIFEKGDFIRSIFDLAVTMKNRFNDEDLIKSTFLNCFDFVGLFEKLPESIKKKVKKAIGEQSIDYSIEKQKLTTAGNIVGKIIYLTRNKVVHAKANYEITGNECSSEDLPILNEFMKEACSQTIRWYNRQPDHYKLSIIK